MSIAITKESYFWHKLHSLTGIIPVGFYLLQHLTLNSFSLEGPEKYNAVSGFFYSMPVQILLGIEILVVWIPLAFHAIYGLFITNRGTTLTAFSTKYKWAQSWMYTAQRLSGMFIFIFLIVHFIQTTVQIKLTGNHETVDYTYMQALLAKYGYMMLVFYMLGVLCAAYHFCYGIWNFCIRWGIAISDRAQRRIQRFSAVLFWIVLALGWITLVGFFKYPPSSVDSGVHVQSKSKAPIVVAIHS